MIRYYAYNALSAIFLACGFYIAINPVTADLRNP